MQRAQLSERKKSKTPNDPVSLRASQRLTTKNDDAIVKAAQNMMADRDSAEGRVPTAELNGHEVRTS